MFTAKQPIFFTVERAFLVGLAPESLDLAINTLIIMVSGIEPRVYSLQFHIGPH